MIAVSILTAGFATVVYGYLYRQIFDGFTTSPFPGGVALFEQYTGRRRRALVRDRQPRLRYRVLERLLGLPTTPTPSLAPWHGNPLHRVVFKT